MLNPPLCGVCAQYTSSSHNETVEKHLRKDESCGSFRTGFRMLYCVFTLVHTWQQGGCSLHQGSAFCSPQRIYALCLRYFYRNANSSLHMTLKEQKSTVRNYIIHNFLLSLYLFDAGRPFVNWVLPCAAARQANSKTSRANRVLKRMVSSLVAVMEKK